MKKLKYLKRITVVALATASIFTITGCEFMNSKVQSMK